ncbi:MAG: WD40 repeat domain-containing protein, partial [Chthoniobacterales bacterium]
MLWPFLAVAQTNPPELLSLISLRGVAQAEFNHDASRVLTRLRTGEIGLWETAAGTAVANELGAAKAMCCLMSPDRKRVLLGFESNARIFDATTGSAVSPVLPIKVDQYQPTPALFSPDGETLVILREEEASIWRVGTGEKIKAIPLAAGPHEEAPPGAFFTATGAHCFIMEPNGTVTRFDTKTWQPVGKVMRHPPTDFSYEFGFSASTDGKWVATHDGGGEHGHKASLQIWDARTGQPLVGITPGVGYFLPGRDRIVVSSDRGQGQVRELPSMKLAYRIRGFDDLSGPPVALSPDGKWILSWNSQNALDAINAKTGATVGTASGSGSVSMVSFAPDSSVAYVFRDNPDDSKEQYSENEISKVTLPDLQPTGI